MLGKGKDSRINFHNITVKDLLDILENPPEEGTGEAADLAGTLSELLGCLLPFSYLSLCSNLLGCAAKKERLGKDRSYYQVACESFKHALLNEMTGSVSVMRACLGLPGIEPGVKIHDLYPSGIKHPRAAAPLSDIYGSSESERKYVDMALMEEPTDVADARKSEDALSSLNLDKLFGG
jgi:hypothetical protein